MAAADLWESIQQATVSMVSATRPSPVPSLDSQSRSGRDSDSLAIWLSCEISGSAQIMIEAVVAPSNALCIPRMALRPDATSRQLSPCLREARTPRRKAKYDPIALNTSPTFALV